MKLSRRISLALVLSTLLAGIAYAQASATNAARFEQKLARIRGEPAAAAGQRTSITEAELNAYLAASGRAGLPAGVIDPHLSILDNGRITGRAIVDLDAVRTSQDRGWLDPLNYLSGRLPVSATGVLHVRDGVGWLDFESAQVSGVQVPKRLLDEMLQYYSRTPNNPEGLTLDDRVQMPAGIRAIDLRRGEAVVIQ